MRFYLGIKGTARKVFKSDVTPTQETHGEQFNAVIGPFRTKRGAMFAAAFVAAIWPAESAVHGSLVEALEYE